MIHNTTASLIPCDIIHNVTKDKKKTICWFRSYFEKSQLGFLSAPPKYWKVTSCNFDPRWCSQQKWLCVCTWLDVSLGWNFERTFRKETYSSCKNDKSGGSCFAGRDRHSRFAAFLNTHMYVLAHRRLFGAQQTAARNTHWSKWLSLRVSFCATKIQSALVWNELTQRWAKLAVTPRSVESKYHALTSTLEKQKTTSYWVREFEILPFLGLFTLRFAALCVLSWPTSHWPKQPKWLGSAK